MAIIKSGPPATTVSSYLSGSERIDERLDKYILRVLPKDLLVVLRGVASDELSQQITRGNVPSQILVDGRAVSRRGILQATRSVSMRFADTALLLRALNDAYAYLLRVTRIQSPAKNSIVARKNFHLYLDGVPVGRMPGAVSKISANLVSSSVLRIVGPLVNYGRKLYWSPIGREKVMAFRAVTSIAGKDIFRYDSTLSPRFKPYRLSTVRKAANAMPGDKAENLKRMLGSRPGTVEAANQIVKRAMRRDRRYAGLYISDGWISYPPAKSWGKSSRDDRVPTLSIQLAKRGAVSIASKI